jgi:hypothetical protein
VALKGPLKTFKRPSKGVYKTFERPIQGLSKAFKGLSKVV